MTVAMELTSDVVQSVVLTRQAIQSIEILEYSTDELGAFLQDKASRNPLIKLSLPRVQTSLPPIPRAGGISASQGSFLDYLPDAPIAFRQDLLRQLSFLRLDVRQNFLASNLIEALDDDGYLRMDLQIQADILNADIKELEAALTQIQKLEPTGIGARSLKECLMLQLAEQGPICPQLHIFLNNLDLLTQGKIERLAKLCKIRPEELPTLLAKLRKLSPRPNIALASDPTLPALPDILVKPLPDGGLGVEMNPDLLPKVLVDNEYYIEITAHLRERKDRSYLRNCLQEANLLVRNLAQRAETSLMVASWIVKLQAEFFTQGPKGLKPLSQKEIAQAAGVHESTVSRSISNRHLLCDQGLFPLKYFFSDGLAATAHGAPSTAATVIRERIKEMIAAETAEAVLSDDDIVDILTDEGIAVARRTVAKYRMQLGIDSSAARRRMRQLDRRLA